MGQMSRTMLERYSHIRMNAKREAVGAAPLLRSCTASATGPCDSRARLSARCSDARAGRPVWRADLGWIGGDRGGGEILSPQSRGDEWPRPGTTTPVAKSTFAKSVKGADGKWYVVGGGGYEVK